MRERERWLELKVREATQLNIVTLCNIQLVYNTMQEITEKIHEERKVKKIGRRSKRKNKRVKEKIV